MRNYANIYTGSKILSRLQRNWIDAKFLTLISRLQQQCGRQPYSTYTIHSFLSCSLHSRITSRTDLIGVSRLYLCNWNRVPDNNQRRYWTFYLICHFLCKQHKHAFLRIHKSLDKQTTTIFSFPSDFSG